MEAALQVAAVQSQQQSDTIAGLTDMVKSLVTALNELPTAVKQTLEHLNHRQSPAPRSARNVECYNCREKGHISRFCPHPRRQQQHQGN